MVRQTRGVFLVFLLRTLLCRYGLNDALGPHLNWFFFVSLIIICGNCLADMMLGILTGLYIREQGQIDVRSALFETCILRCRGVLGGLALGVSALGQND